MKHVREKARDGASLYQLFYKRNVHHLDRKPLNWNGEVGDTDTHTFAHRPLASDGVEVGVHNFIASVILRQQCGNLCICHIGCHTTHFLCGK